MPPKPKPDPKQIFLDVIQTKIVHAKWAGSPHEAFKNLANSSKGDAGEEFLAKYATALGFAVETSGGRLGDWDVKIEKSRYEVKLATEDISGAFQFNHIRYDSKYDYLICIGVTPNGIEFGIWTKGQVAEGEAGSLVSMGKNQNSSFKLTKRVGLLTDIGQLEKELNRLKKIELKKATKKVVAPRKMLAKKAAVKKAVLRKMSPGEATPKER